MICAWGVQVDVWSVGVVLYQMLYGRRPFGEGCSQEKILRDEIMLHAKEVTFPSKPAVSAEGKDFILKCGYACVMTAVHAVLMHGVLNVPGPAEWSAAGWSIRMCATVAGLRSDVARLKGCTCLCSCSCSCTVQSHYVHDRLFVSYRQRRRPPCVQHWCRQVRCRSVAY